MSKIAKKPVQIKEGVTVTLDKNKVAVVGPKGNQVVSVPEGIIVKMEGSNINVSQTNEKDKKLKALCGLTWANIKNSINGVSQGFEKKLEMVGVGYRAQASGNSITLSVGFSHPVIIKADGIQFSVADNVITVAGDNKTLVGDTAAKIRKVRPPEPYKGKGIKYAGEKIRRKAGKAAKAIGGAVK
jgi:large subunit ribosomal protein L6